MNRLRRPFACALLLASACGAADTSAPSATGARRLPLNVCAHGETVPGIDVSKWQGTIDWSAVAASGRVFAITRVSDGTGYRDQQFQRNWREIPANGMVRGVYQFFRPGQDPIAQADLLLAAIAADPIGESDLGPVLDIEVTDGQSAATVRANMQAWLDRVAAGTGRTPLVYSAAFMSPTIGTDFAPYPLWVANWTTGCARMPDGWTDWWLWQHSSKGAVPGISGNVDLDVFNGPIADLYELMATDAAASAGATAARAPRAAAAAVVDGVARLAAPASLGCGDGGCAMGAGARAAEQ